MAYYKKDGEDVWVEIFEYTTNVWLLPFLVTNPNFDTSHDPNKTLAARSSATVSYYASEALAIAALSGYSVFNLSSVPATPTINTTSIISGGNVNITIAVDGDIQVYRDTLLLTTLSGETAGVVNYTPPSQGNYYFVLVASGISSAPSETLNVATATGTVASGIIFPSEHSGAVVWDNGYVLMNIVQTGSFGQILTNTEWGAANVQLWSNGHAFGATDWKWSINNGPWQTSSFTNIDLGTDMAGEIVKAVIGISFVDGAPLYTFETIIQIGT